MIFFYYATSFQPYYLMQICSSIFADRSLQQRLSQPCMMIVLHVILLEAFSLCMLLYQRLETLLIFYAFSLEMSFHLEYLKLTYFYTYCSTSSHGKNLTTPLKKQHQPSEMLNQSLWQVSLILYFWRFSLYLMTLIEVVDPYSHKY